ncbi:hypothetical protein Nmel_005573, partial [Mimus melanotis]
ATRLYPPLPPSDSEEEGPSPQDPIASRTHKQTREAIQAPLRETVTSEGMTVLTERQFVLKVAKDLAEDDRRTTQEDVKDVLPLQDPEGLEELKRYQELIVKGLERAIPRTINWSTLYAIKQGPSQTLFEFLDQLRDAMG